jgi:uncharacterized protein (DUF2236 family)
MTAPLFATDEELDEIILGPESLVWQRFGDARLFLAAGYALMLQVAHPTVGSGVRDHSNFRSDPWGRLLRTVDYLTLLIYGGREAAAMGRRLRDMHKTIKGRNPDGSRYSALEPEPYAWVHATLIEGAIAAHLRFVGPLTSAEIQRFYSEYLPLGRLVGVRPDDLPADWPEFQRYVDRMISQRLERNETVDAVLETMSQPAPPPVPVVAGLWPLLKVPPAEVLHVATVGLMSPQLRRRLGIPWSRAREAELRVLGAAARAAGPILPQQLRNIGPPYLRWRAREIEAGPLGPGADRLTAAAA